MPDPIVGQCSGTVSTVLQASATALGFSKQQAYDRARAQAETLLDAWSLSVARCPNECPNVTQEVEPDYDLAPPAYTTPADAPGISSCTVQLARRLVLTCGTDPTVPVDS